MKHLTMNTYKFRNIDGKILTVETDNITRAVEIAGRYGFFEFVECNLKIKKQKK